MSDNKNNEKAKIAEQVFNEHVLAIPEQLLHAKFAEKLAKEKAREEKAKQIEEARKKRKQTIKDEWRTPQDLYDELNAEFRFIADACATAENKLAKFYFKDCTTVDWVDEIKRLKDRKEKIHFKKRAIFMNPPYSDVGRFVHKALIESQRIKVVCLVPNSIITCRYLDVMDNNRGKTLFRDFNSRIEFRFLSRRTRFNHPVLEPSNPPGGCMILIMSPLQE
jgi:phage N-6-adenine-methyltransferase